MKKIIKRIDMEVLDIEEQGLDVYTEKILDPLSEKDILVTYTVHIGNTKTKNYRYCFIIESEMRDFYENQNFDTTDEIVEFIDKNIKQDVIDLIKCYDMIVTNKTYAS